MFGLFKSVFDYNAKHVSRIRKIVDGINALEDEVRAIPDVDFSAETARLKAQYANGEITLDTILPRAFALTREAARRTLGMRHYDVQLIAGVALHEGKIVEQKTGEGKTLTATTALYLNALTGKGAHLVTVNDYLARRDAGWMGQVFHFLGLSTSAIISGQSLLFDPAFKHPDIADPRMSHLRPISRKEAYATDITYGINSEFGFDYLRDNMAHTSEGLVQRGFHFAIVDEADSVLIDEARTPHIISAPYEQDVSRYYEYAKIVKHLQAETDYVIDEKLRTAHLTEAGIARIESILHVENIYEKDFDTLFYIEAALKARTLFQNDKEYIVRNGEVIIVDEFTGRLLEGRRFSEGLHQAIEAKEGVAIKQESRTLATVSLQNYFRMYEKLAGMTGTAATEAEEFHKIYKTEVLVIPTHRSMRRIDHPDMIFKTTRAKFNAVVEDIAQQYKNGRPVLVGTTAIDKNEYLSKLLRAKGIPHELLNAKNHEREAHIIAQAGKKHAVTVATNMAGRGVDIVLGGDFDPAAYDTEAKRKKAHEAWQKEHDEVVELGGLCVVGTERHESRRIDNQLRGRAGRQGDSGETRFYVSLEDDVMRIFGGEQIANMMTMLKFPEDQPLSHGMVSRAIEQAQVKVEGFNFDIRKHLVEYDDVLNRQRDIVYSLRRKVLHQPDEDTKAFDATIIHMVDEQITRLTSSYFSLPDREEAMQDEFYKDLTILFDIPEKKLLSGMSTDDQIESERFLKETVRALFRKKEKAVGGEIWRSVVRSVVISTIDQYWTQHLTAIDDLRQGINLRGFAQMDPLVEYKNEAFRMFEKLLADIGFEAVRRMMRLEIQPAQETPEPAPSLLDTSDVQFAAAQSLDPFGQSQREESGKDPSGIASHAVPHKKHIGRNDPCWCGSGKKYKKCHLFADGA